MAEAMRRIAAALPVAVVGLAAILLARDFPPIPGQAYGPALFPTLLGAALVACAIGVALQAPGPRAEPVTARGRIAGIAYALAPLVVVLAWDVAGWPLIAFGLGAALLVLGGARPLVALLAGLGFAAVTWVLFAMLLRVPLPRGPLGFLPY
ncbi:tripartite tricarboxylate transporter TctB family protein [Falsiroseomonas oryzae]|uniref:tripartite tricarboxylate transporter TctB family protein n=1 Tax=Falsiroseomonas oryzae TaxID=2766473 RepID=UPI0022EAE047|nr:tripartite tricarboxylate transporter TctB family protein [Roseomonas sp. MO-31]